MTGSGRTCSGAVKGMVANMTIDVKNTLNRLNSFKLSHFVGSAFATFDTNKRRNLSSAELRCRNMP